MKNDTENITTFINDNLEKISKNKLMPDISTTRSTQPKLQSVTQSVQPTTYMKSLNITSGKGFTFIKYLLLILLFGFLCLVAWYYIHKYFPSWKTKIVNFFNYQYTNIKAIFTKKSTGGGTSGTSGGTSKASGGTSGEKKSKPSNANLLTKAQMNNFHHKEKVSSEPQPYKYEETLFDTNNNLNSNEILNYLLDNETENTEWCYIGESDEKRYCSISQGNKCMSGNVFPTQDLCLNPKIM